MKFNELEIQGVWTIEPEPYSDERGKFWRHFCQNEFTKNGLNGEIKQTNISVNHKKHTLRGFHYQVKPYQEAKTMTCLTGGVHVVVVDLRPESKTCLKWIAVELSSKNNLSLHLPEGCAVAFLTLEDNTTVLYYMSKFFQSDSYRGFRYNDSFFGIKFPVKPKIISEKDRNYPDFVPGKTL